MGFLTPLGIIPVFQKLEALELGLNTAGYFPVLSKYTADYIRKGLSIVEIVVGVALAVFSFCAFVAGATLSSFYLNTAVVLLGHGLLNHIRCEIERETLCSLFFCLPYDILNSNWSWGGRIFSYII